MTPAYADVIIVRMIRIYLPAEGKLYEEGLNLRKNRHLSRNVMFGKQIKLLAKSMMDTLSDTKN